MNSSASSDAPTRHRSTFRPLVVALLLTLSESLVLAATVRGVIVHHSGQPGRYVAVRLTPAQGPPTPFVNSGGDGWYYINGVPAGDYTLEVWVNEQEIVKAAVSVHEPTTDVPKVEIP